jgi:hypothetical protein
MLISAAVFGYFGFGTTWIHTSQLTGGFLLFVALLDWTLKSACVGFVVSAVVTFVAPRLGSLLYSLVGLGSAILFVVVAGLDFMDKQHAALDPLILLLFAAWNGYGSWMGIRELVAATRRSSAPEKTFGADGR